MPNVVIEGSGGREFAIGEALIAEGNSVFVDPGNAGTEGNGFLSERPDDPDLVIIGPEAPLVEGRADELRGRLGNKVLGISQATSFLEASKVDAGEFMRRHEVLHPPFVVSESVAQGRDWIEGADPSEYVLKADKLAGGKGVVLPKTAEEAEEVLRGMHDGTLFDGAGKERVQIQDRWHGPEVSAFAIGDGSNHYVIPFLSQDHKRLGDGDTGPNTGGMGAYANVPTSIVSDAQREKIYEAIDKTYEGLKKERFDSRGILYFSFMLAEESGGDPAMIEYNIRFGDPEAQVVLPLMTQAGIDTYDLFRSAAEGGLRPEDFAVATDEQFAHSALTRCLAVRGYPEKPEKGDQIFGVDEAEYEGVLLHHGGTGREGGMLKTAGGRVLYVTGLGSDIQQAERNSAAAIGEENNGVYFSGMQYRTDVGHQAL